MKKIDHNIVFFAENWQKSQKIVIITPTPDTFYKKKSATFCQF
jgi:hypothetical protein